MPDQATLRLTLAVTLQDGALHPLEPGDIVEVPQRHREGLDIRDLQLVERDNAVHAVDQGEVEAILPDPTLGPTLRGDHHHGKRHLAVVRLPPIAWHQGPADYSQEGP